MTPSITKTTQPPQQATSSTEEPVSQSDVTYFEQQLDQQAPAPVPAVVAQPAKTPVIKDEEYYKRILSTTEGLTSEEVEDRVTYNLLTKQILKPTPNYFQDDDEQDNFMPKRRVPNI